MKTIFIKWAATLITYLPWTHRRSLLVDRLLILLERDSDVVN